MNINLLSHYRYTCCSNKVSNSYIDVPLPISAFTHFVSIKNVCFEYILSTDNITKTPFS